MSACYYDAICKGCNSPASSMYINNKHCWGLMETRYCGVCCEYREVDWRHSTACTACLESDADTVSMSDESIHSDPE